jgi:hypothetical protein
VPAGSADAIRGQRVDIREVAVGLRSWINQSPVLEAGEAIAWELPAVLSADGRHTVSGSLFVTDRSVIFQPNRVNTSKNDPMAFPIDAIVGVERVERTGTLYDGGMRRRLRIVTADGTRTMFIVRDLDGVISRLSNAVAARRPGAQSPAR